MPTRFDVERALEISGLPQTARDIGFALCRRMTVGGTDIPAEHSPSLTKLARVIGVNRRTIMRHLHVLERAGWITRHRPDPHDARTQHRTTRYTVTIPSAGPAPSPGVPTGPAEATEIAIVTDELEKRTGVIVGADWAAKIRAELLGKPGIRDPAAWIRKCIQSEPNPRRWLPTSQPPQWPQTTEGKPP